MAHPSTHPKLVSKEQRLAGAVRVFREASSQRNANIPSAQAQFIETTEQILNQPKSGFSWDRFSWSLIGGKQTARVLLSRQLLWEYHKELMTNTDGPTATFNFITNMQDLFRDHGPLPPAQSSVAPRAA